MLKRWVKIISFLVLFGLVITGRVMLHSPKYFPITKVKVTTTYKHISPAEIQQIIAPLVGKSFFGVSLSNIRQRLLHDPWIYRASVARVWPSSIAITLEEQQPIARWNADSFLNIKGGIFTPKNSSAVKLHLPQLYGPTDFEKEMLVNYSKMENELQSKNLAVQILAVDSQHAWSLRLTNGMTVLLGNSNVMQKLQRFLQAYSKVVAAHKKKIVTADLRYSNGFAIKWK